MPRLIAITRGLEEQVFELRLGVNRFGRGPRNDFQINHPTVSTQHCEISLGNDELTVRDCGSTNGTFIDDRPIKESCLRAGQVLRLGEIEFSVDATIIAVAIPTFKEA